MAVAATSLVTLADLKTFLGVTSGGTDTILEQCIDRASKWVESYCGRRLTDARVQEVYDTFGHDRIVLKNPPAEKVYFVGALKQTVLSVYSIDQSDAFASISNDSTSIYLNRRTSGGTETITTLSLTTYDTTNELATAINAVAGFRATANLNIPSMYLDGVVGRDLRISGCLLQGWVYSLSDYGLDAERGIIYGDSLSGYQSVLVDYTGGYATIPYDIVQATLTVAARFYRDRTRDMGIASESLGGYSYSRRAAAEQQQEIRDLLAQYRRIR
jgi:hypothetical protein